MKHYAVASGRSIAFKSSMSEGAPFGFGTITEGEIFSEDDPRWTPENIEKFVKNGSVIEIANPSDMAGVQRASGGGSDRSDDVVTASAFTLDPDGLTGMKLDQLNVMLDERGAKPARSVKEAIANLSADYEPPKT